VNEVTNELADGRRNWREAAAEGLAAFVLAITALLTSWAGFQAALWDGEQAANYAEAGAARVRAGVLTTENGQREAEQLFVFAQWFSAVEQGNAKLQQDYEKRFGPEFRPYFEQWLSFKPLTNPSAPLTPFALKGYQTHFARDADAMTAKADALFAKGQKANAISDAFTRATVIFALALFLAGIGQTFKRNELRILMSVIAAAACLVGFIEILELPALHLGSG
jgi:hypothetical protein